MNSTIFFMQFSTCDLMIIFFGGKARYLVKGEWNAGQISVHLLYNMEPLHPAVHQLVFGVVSVPPFGQYVDI